MRREREYRFYYRHSIMHVIYVFLPNGISVRGQVDSPNGVALTCCRFRQIGQIRLVFAKSMYRNKQIWAFAIITNRGRIAVRSGEEMLLCDDIIN